MYKRKYPVQNWIRNRSKRYKCGETEPTQGFIITEIQDIDVLDTPVPAFFNFQPVTVTNNSKIKIEANMWFSKFHEPSTETDGWAQISLFDETTLLYQVNQGFRVKETEAYIQYETLDLLWITDVSPGTYNFSITADMITPPATIDRGSLVLTVLTEK